MKRLVIILAILLLGKQSFAQVSQEVREQLDTLALSQIGLNEKVQINVSGATLADFISAISLEHNLNVSVQDNLNTAIVTNFYDATVKDVFIFLADKHQLDIDIIGSIISFKKHVDEPAPPQVYQPKDVRVNYRTDNEFLSVDLKRDSLYRVAEAITKKSGRNVVLAPSIREKLISVYIENRPFDQTMKMLAKSNDLKLTIDAEGFYYLEKDVVAQQNQNVRQNQRNGKDPGLLNMQLSSLDNKRLDVVAENISIKTIIEQGSDLLGEKYFMYDVPEGNTTLNVEDVTYAELMMHVMRGTEYTFRKDEKYYLIGNRNSEGLRETQLIQLQNRTLESVMTVVPQELMNGIETKEFVDLNGLIVSGSYPRIAELKTFIQSIDQVVPMVQVDIIIVQQKKSATTATGIKAGLSDSPVQTSGDVFPAVDMTLNSESINGLLGALEGFGVINLGAVTPNFYLSLKALESNSLIDIASTPKISTLNGHEATFSIGETNYYQEQNVQISPSLSGGNVLENRVWKATDANLTITVTPNVSADEYVTLDINVEQTDFAGKEDPTAPPNKQTQTFSSLVRVKNGEMILMGGLEKDAKSESGSGTPVLSRIPIIKWFFSSREKEKEKSKLHVFIRTTVTY